MKIKIIFKGDYFMIFDDVTEHNFINNELVLKFEGNKRITFPEVDIKALHILGPSGTEE